MDALRARFADVLLSVPYQHQVYSAVVILSWIARELGAAAVLPLESESDLFDTETISKITRTERTHASQKMPANAKYSTKATGAGARAGRGARKRPRAAAMPTHFSRQLNTPETSASDATDPGVYANQALFANGGSSSMDAAAESGDACAPHFSARAIMGRGAGAIHSWLNVSVGGAGAAGVFAGRSTAAETGGGTQPRKHAPRASDLVQPSERTSALPSQQELGDARGCILAEDMGMGKTLISHMVSYAFGGVSLLVVPSSMLEHWLFQAERHFRNQKRAYPMLKYADVGSSAAGVRALDAFFAGVGARPCGVVVSHSIFRAHYQDVFGNAAHRARWAGASPVCARWLLVLDEGDVARNPLTVIAHMVACFDSAARVIITASPFHNDTDTEWLSYAKMTGLAAKEYVFPSEKSARKMACDVLRRYVIRRMLRLTLRDAEIEIPECAYHYVMVDLSIEEKVIYMHLVHRIECILARMEPATSEWEQDVCSTTGAGSRAHSEDGGASAGSGGAGGASKRRKFAEKDGRGPGAAAKRDLFISELIRLRQAAIDPHMLPVHLFRNVTSATLGESVRGVAVGALSNGASDESDESDESSADDDSEHAAGTESHRQRDTARFKNITRLGDVHRWNNTKKTAEELALGARGAGARAITAREIARVPAVIPHVEFAIPAISQKILAIGRLCMQFHQEKSKVVVFCDWIQPLCNIHSHLRAIGVTCILMEGSLDSTQKERAIHAFRTDVTVTAFLSTLKSGAYGICMPEANKVIIAHPGYNPTVERHAVARVHRLGQEKCVDVYYVIAKSSYEVVTHAIACKKAKNNDTNTGVTDAKDYTFLETYGICSADATTAVVKQDSHRACRREDVEKQLIMDVISNYRTNTEAADVNVELLNNKKTLLVAATGIVPSFAQT